MRNLIAGWMGMVLGALMGMTIGLWADSRQWMGGYDSLPRQAVRLAHISLFALGMINVLYGLTAQRVTAAGRIAWIQRVGSMAMIAGGFLMPAVCLLTAWNTSCKYLFPIPATCVLVGLSAQLICLWASRKAEQ